MRFETSQHMKMGQQMKLAPRMIQSMEILQMPLAELEERLEQELASNPTLELVEGDPDANPQGDAQPDASAAADARADERPTDDHSPEAEFERLDAYEADNPDAVDNAYDGRLRDEGGPEVRESFSASREAGERDAKLDAMAAAPARAASLTDQLLAQWGLCDIDDRTRRLGEQVIEFLDADGYLRTPLEEVADRVPADVRALEPTATDWDEALQAVQLLLEPAGVAARDARECLLLQLDALDDLEGEDAASEAQGDARELIEDHLDDLMNNRLPRIAQRTGMDLDRINRAIGALRRLSLAPARRLVVEDNHAITPDAIIEYDDEHDRYVAFLNERRASQMRINREVALLAKDRGLDRKDRDFIKTNLSNARWLLDAIGQRRHTLLRVIQAVIEEQRDALDYGPEAIKPLPMKTVADRLGIHVATVSRAVADKWVQTPRGVVALRGFFTQGLATDSGEDASANEIKAALRDIIDTEDKNKPLSDDALSKALKDKGYEVARRTVAKYRGQLEIQSARLRRQFAG